MVMPTRLTRRSFSLVSLGVLGVLGGSPSSPSVARAENVAPGYEKRWLSGMFYGEGANFGDFNNDGKADVVSGPFIYEGPEFTMKREFMPPAPTDPLGYSANFFAFAYDFNGDQWQDVLIVGFPGADVHWYENPKDGKEHWKKHHVFKGVDNESPTFADVTGDGVPELVCMNGGRIGYATFDKADPAKMWTFHPAGTGKDYQRFTHGIGVGDVNGDGRMDLLEKTGWWEQPASLEGNAEWKKHAHDFGGPGGSQMYAYDVDADGDNDVISAIAAHGYGLAWYEQQKESENVTFKRHLILSDKGEEKIEGVQFSQPHAVALVDMDGDGTMDLLTGKRYWAHGPKGDPDSNGPAVLYTFRLVREQGKTPKFVPTRIDDNSGVGTQIVARDANGDGKPDVIVGNKKGTILFLTKK